MKNGIIVPPASLTHDGAFVTNQREMKSSLHTSLLYWQHVAAPVYGNANFIKTGYEDYVGELYRAELIESPFYNEFQKNLPMNAKQGALNSKLRMLFKNRRARAGENWGIMPIASDKELEAVEGAISASSGSKQALLHLRLAQALPVPGPDANPHDIINFREKNLDKLDELHAGINRLAATYAALEDEEEPLLRAQDELSDAMQGYTTDAQATVARFGMFVLELVVASGAAGIWSC